MTCVLLKINFSYTFLTLGSYGKDIQVAAGATHNQYIVYHLLFCCSGIIVSIYCICSKKKYIKLLFEKIKTNEFPHEIVFNQAINSLKSVEK